MALNSLDLTVAWLSVHPAEHQTSIGQKGSALKTLPFQSGYLMRTRLSDHAGDARRGCVDASEFQPGACVHVYVVDRRPDVNDHARVDDVGLYAYARAYALLLHAYVCDHVRSSQSNSFLSNLN